MNLCKCGCGQEVSKNWATGHHRRGTTFSHTSEAKEKCRQQKLGQLNPRFGKPGTQLGKRQSEESKEKIRIARAKQVITKEQRIATSIRVEQEWKDGRRRKESLSFYIDGRSALNKHIRQTVAYRRWRREVFERDDFTCQLCRQRGGELQADHIKPQSIYPEFRFDVSNGRTLCRPCHQTTDTWGLRLTHDKTKTTNLLLAVGMV